MRHSATAMQRPGGRLASEGRRKWRASRVARATAARGGTCSCICPISSACSSPHTRRSRSARRSSSRRRRAAESSRRSMSACRRCSAAWCSTAPAVALSCWSASTKACSRRRSSAASCGLPVICLLRVLHVLCPRLSPLSVHCPAQRRHLRLCRRVPHPQRRARLLGLPRPRRAVLRSGLLPLRRLGRAARVPPSPRIMLRRLAAAGLRCPMAAAARWLVVRRGLHREDRVAHGLPLGPRAHVTLGRAHAQLALDHQRRLRLRHRRPRWLGRRLAAGSHAQIPQQVLRCRCLPRCGRRLARCGRHDRLSRGSRAGHHPAAAPAQRPAARPAAGQPLARPQRVIAAGETAGRHAQRERGKARGGWACCVAQGEPGLSARFKPPLQRVGPPMRHADPKF